MQPIDGGGGCNAITNYAILSKKTPNLGSRIYIPGIYVLQFMVLYLTIYASCLVDHFLHTESKYHFRERNLIC